MATNENKRLIVRIGHDSLAFLAVDHDGFDYQPYELNSSISIAANMRQALQSMPLLEQSFGKVVAMVDSPVLMVPVELFREEDSETLYHHAFMRRQQYAVAHDVLPDLNAVALYAVGRDLLTVLRDHYPHLQLSSVLIPVWRHLHQRSFTGDRHKLYCYFHERRMEVFSFQQNRFRFCNSYVVNCPNDALYYMLAVWKQLALRPDQDEIYVVGDIRERDALQQEMQRFLKRVYFIHPSGEFNRAPITQQPDIPYDVITYMMKGR